MTIRTEMSLIPLYIGALSKAGRTCSEADEQILLQYTSVCCWLVLQDSRGRFESATETPGYLRTAVASRSYYVPYHLTAVLPSIEALAHIDQLVDFFRLSSDSAFCLSGSAMFLGQVTSIADLDFCEYYVGRSSALEKNILSKIESAGDAALLLVKINRKSHRPPFSELKTLLEGDATKRNGRSDTIQDPLKLDFVVATNLFGGIAATNLVLPVDEKFTSQNVNRSYQFQEAVILEGRALPKRHLFDPGQLGRYIVWLLEDAKKYINVADNSTEEGERVRLSVKALKRLMSAFLIVQIPDDWNAIAKTLQRPEVARVATMARLSAIRELIDELPADIQPMLKKQYLGKSRISTAIAKRNSRFFDEILLLAKNLASDLDERLTVTYEAH